MAIVRKKIDFSTPLTVEQEEEFKKLQAAPFVYDEDCPPLTDEQIEEIKVMIKAKRKSEQKQLISLRMTNKYIEKAKRLGKGYTSILGGILEYVLDNPELLKQCIAEIK